MKVVIIQPWLGYRGAEAVSLALARGLERFGHEVTVVAVYVDEKSHSARSGGARVVTAPAPWSRICRAHPLLYLALGPLSLLLLVWSASKHADMLNPHNPPALLIAALVGRIRRIPVVWTCHSVPSRGKWTIGEEILESLARWLARSRAERWALGACNVVIANSQRTARILRDLYAVSAMVVYPPLPDNPWRTSCDQYLPHDCNRIIVVGHLDARKNQSGAIKALALVKESIPDAELVLAGDGPFTKRLEAETDAHGLGTSVRFLGYVPARQLYEVYRTCRVALLPAFNEPWGLTAFEAISAGCTAIVSSESGAAEEVGRHNIGLVTRPEPAAMAEAILRVLQNSRMREAFAYRGFRYLRHNLTENDYTQACLDVFTHARLISKGRQQRSSDSRPVRLQGGHEC